eukprot:7500150-Pyramimonas_sp.AAC.1
MPESSLTKQPRSDDARRHHPRPTLRPTGRITDTSAYREHRRPRLHPEDLPTDSQALMATSKI